MQVKHDKIKLAIFQSRKWHLFRVPQSMSLSQIASPKVPFCWAKGLFSRCFFSMLTLLYGTMDDHDIYYNL